MGEGRGRNEAAGGGKLHRETCGLSTLQSGHTKLKALLGAAERESRNPGGRIRSILKLCVSAQELFAQKGGFALIPGLLGEVLAAQVKADAEPLYKRAEAAGGNSGAVPDQTFLPAK